MPVSSLIVGRIVDFDVDADTSLYELVAVDSYGHQRRVGHLSRDAGGAVRCGSVRRPATRHAGPAQAISQPQPLRRLGLDVAAAAEA